MTDPNHVQPPRYGAIKRTIGGSLARSWPHPLPRCRRCCVLQPLLLGLSAAAAVLLLLLSLLLLLLLLLQIIVVLLLLLLCAEC